MNADQIGGLIRALIPGAVALGAHYGLDSTTVTIVLTAIATAVVAIWSAITNTQASMIQSVNGANNGVKVVADTVVAPAVSAPLKGN